MDTSCKLLADKKICNPWCHWALHHQFNYCESKSLNFKIPYKTTSIGGFQLLP